MFLSQQIAATYGAAGQELTETAYLRLWLSLLAWLEVQREASVLGVSELIQTSSNSPLEFPELTKKQL